MTCPFCRAEFDKLFVPVIDTELQKELALSDPEAFEMAKEELKQAGQWRGEKKAIRFAFGNTHSIVDKTGKTKNNHRWTMFVALNGDNAQTAKYVKSVTYHLHPTFKVNKIKLTEAPFLLARVGWGWFDIQIDIDVWPKKLNV